MVIRYFFFYENLYPDECDHYFQQRCSFLFYFMVTGREAAQYSYRHHAGEGSAEICLEAQERGMRSRTFWGFPLVASLATQGLIALG
jgi:hypothetical protein